MLRIEELYASETEKLKRLRLALAKKTQEIHLVKRKIDDIPTRTELVQYERRFVELYEQVAAKLEETRRYYIRVKIGAGALTAAVQHVDGLEEVLDEGDIHPQLHFRKLPAGHVVLRRREG